MDANEKYVQACVEFCLPHEVIKLKKGAKISHLTGSHRKSYFLLQGKASGYINSSGGVSVLLAECWPGYFICRETSFGYERELTYVIGSKTATLLSMHNSTFETLIQSKNGAERDLFDQITNQFRVAQRRVFELSAYSAEMRVRAELIRLILPTDRLDGHRVIRPTPVFSEVAERIGSTRETVSRTISALERQKTILRKPGAILVVALHVLSKDL